MNAAKNWLLGFAHPNWHLTPGETFAIDVTFDGQAQFHLFGTAVSPILVTSILPGNTVNDLRKSHLMVATAKGQTFQFNLTSTDRLLPAISNCLTKTITAGVENAGDFSSPPPPKPTTPVKSTAPEPGPPTTPPSAASAAPPSKLIAVSGTGFVISSNGHILTNAHVVSECSSDVYGNLAGEPMMTLRTVSMDEENDLALLQSSISFKDFAAIRATAAHPGDAVVAIGFPFHGMLTSDFTVTTGIVNSLSGMLNNTRYLQISAPIQPGNSGGPLFDTSGNVVGVVAA